MTEQVHIIVGLGATGLSCARYLQKKNIPFWVMDSRENPPNITDFKTAYPDVPVFLGNLDESILAKAEKIILSPGIALQEKAIAKQVARGVPIIGDIELFAEAVTKPVIAITGTNAKSTVTTLVGQMAKTAGMIASVGGNLGTPALDLLETAAAELFVLELSSFQLETLYSLKPTVATILNITPDHMDRYADVDAYRQAKMRVYSHCQVAVCNRDDVLTDCDVPNKFIFTLNSPGKREFGLLTQQGETFLAFETERLLRVKELPIIGKHYQANALAALAIGYGFGLPMDAMLQTLREFKGLPHRCQLVRLRNGVYWYNDSKGTNVGATLAAIEGLGADIEGKIILIAGGLGKNADFSTLLPAMEKYAKEVVLIGEAAPIFANLLEGKVPFVFAKSLEEAVVLADKTAKADDCVLLSPACASQDMFKNFEHRGEVFSRSVMELK